MLTHVVSVTISGAGSTAPSGPQTVIDGKTLSLMITADPGYALQSAAGCCGNLVDTTYTTEPIIGDCSVTVIFVEAAPGDEAVALPALDGRSLLLMSFVLIGAATLRQRRVRR